MLVTHQKTTASPAVVFLCAFSKQANKCFDNGCLGSNILQSLPRQLSG
ncbi:hypothetical protein KPSA1_02345 [Pseudomonas syringae pv. actinidiae]|uniref:Uncharacterized protein n=1 Tax=Pseudomonas syringae pv. actinidiae TaxID=103796 RepID=A0A2V0QF56_PSESF|nr:hypothetical protein KPSA1_02345 [Pseudomonas syringae pv. actinidiae]